MDRHFMPIEQIQAVLSKLCPHDQQNALAAMPSRLRSLVDPGAAGGVCKHMDLPCMKLHELVRAVHQDPSLANHLPRRLHALVREGDAFITWKQEVPSKHLEAIEKEIAVISHCCACLDHCWLVGSTYCHSEDEDATVFARILQARSIRTIPKGG